MSFFKSIEQHLSGMNLNVVISKNDNGLTVSVLPQPTCKDDAMKNLTPILLKGTADELDAQFAGIIQQPLEKVSGISANLIQFEKNVEIQAEKTAIVKAKKDATKKLTDKADKELVKAEEHIKKDEISKAILKIEAALKFAPDYKKAKDLLAKHKKSDDMFAVVEEVKTEVAPEPKAEVSDYVAQNKIEGKKLQEEFEAAQTKEETTTNNQENLVAQEIITKEPTSMKEVGMEEQQRQTLPPNSLQKVDPHTGENIGEPVDLSEPITITEVAQASPNVEIVSIPKAENPAATVPSATPVEEKKTDLQIMTEQEQAQREAAFEAEKVIQTEPIKVETPQAPTPPPASASDNIEILG